nr:hypothetical protein [Tanacetum cinerariifolium]
HNVVAILEKSDAAEGFAQIIDFLSGRCIHYALTVNSHIYISCIKQFWNTAAVKRSGDVTSAIRTSWNEFSTSMASAVICLSKGQKFNFSKVGKVFSRVETPLFEGMLAVGQPAEEGLVAEQVQVNDAAAATVKENISEDVSHAAIPSPPPHDIPSSSQEPSSPPHQHQSSSQAPPQDAEFPTQLQQFLNICFALSKRVENLENDNAAQKLVIVKLKERGRMIADMDMNEGIELVKDAEVAESKGRHAEKQAEIYNLDSDHSSKVLSMQEDDSEVQEVVEVVTTAKLITEVVIAAASHVSAASTTIPAASATILAAKPTIPTAAPTVVAAYTKKRKGRYQGMKKRPQTESEARKNMMIYLKNTAGYKMDFFKGMTYAQICPIFQARKHLEVVEDEDDDVFVDATPLVQKVPVVDYQIVLVDNKPRFSTSKPTNFSDEYLLLTLKTMFEEPDGQDVIWRNQKSVHGLGLVKRWKLLTSCGVHVITLSTVQLFLLVERRTRSSANLFPTLDNLELTIRIRSCIDPTLLNNSEMAAEGNSDLPVPDLWTMEELCQRSLNSWGGPIASIAIQATNFGLKNDMIQQV